MSESTADFRYCILPVINKRVFRLGLSSSYGIDAAAIQRALDSEINYVFWTNTSRGMTDPLCEAIRKDRDRYVIATGPTLGYTRGAIRRKAESALKTLKTDYIDVFQLFWMGVSSAWTEGNEAELLKLKEEGKIRAIGISIHDRPRAGQMVLSTPIDLFMVRYNAAHPGAEHDIFPSFQARRPAVVAYTATSWGKLLKRPRGWDGPMPTAGDCYRFSLSSPHVDLALTGPASEEQLRENIRALEQGPMVGEELARMRELGRLVHG